MAQQTINSNSTQPLGGPNQGVGTDQGDLWDLAVTKLNAMFSDLYGGTYAPGTSNTPAVPVGITSYLYSTSTAGGSSSTLGMPIVGLGVIELTTVGDYALQAPAAAGQTCTIIFRATKGSTASGVLTSMTVTATAAGGFFESNGVTATSGFYTVLHATAATGLPRSVSLIAQSSQNWNIVGGYNVSGTAFLATA